jgi:hypothetical protein
MVRAMIHHMHQYLPGGHLNRPPERPVIKRNIGKGLRVRQTGRPIFPALMHAWPRLLQLLEVVIARINRILSWNPLHPLQPDPVAREDVHECSQYGFVRCLKGVIEFFRRKLAGSIQ